MENCIFCQLASGDIPTEVVYEDEKVFAFKDMAPKAPVHYLFIPKEHIDSADAFAEDADPAIVGDIYRAIAAVARRDGFAQSGYRIINNTGEDGGQTVHHLHFHVLAGKKIRFEGFDAE